MSIHKFCAEGRFECGLDKFVAGKVWAFTAVIRDLAYGLGIAVANEPGFNPIPLTWCHGDNWLEMDEHASELNRANGVSEEQELRIVLSTMGKKRTPLDARTCRSLEEARADRGQDMLSDKPIIPREVTQADIDRDFPDFKP